MRRTVVVAIAAASALGVAAAARGQSAPPALTPGQVESLLELPAGNSPEGVAIDSRGRVFVSNRVFGATEVANQILRVFPDGRSRVFATLPPTDPATAQHILGLAADVHGDVYAALASFDPRTSGVYRIRCRGRVVERLPGSEGIVFPNALTFDSQGNLYATDSLGAVWRYRRHHGVFQAWARHALLEPIPDQDPFGGPLPGANGIAFRWPNELYVANTEKGLIARIEILRDGSAGAVDLVTDGVPVVDGIAVDVRGDIHAVLPAFLLVGTPPLVRVDPDSGSITPTVPPEEHPDFDTPLSAAFGIGRNRRTLYVTNGAVPLPLPPGAGPGVVRVGLDVPGVPR